MSLTSTNALVSISVNGVPTPLAYGGTFNTTAGQTLTFSLQSTSLVQRWELALQSDDQTLNGQRFAWSAGQANQIAVTCPIAPFTLKFTSLVSDGASSTASAPGTVIGASGSSGNQGQSNITLANGLNSDVATTGLSVLRVGGPTAAFSIGGIATTSATKSGLPITIINTTQYQLTIVNEDPSSTAANRITTWANGGSKSVNLRPYGGACQLVYDTTANRWQLQHRGWETQAPRHIDVRDFGAVGSGAVDDTAAVDAAIAAAQALAVVADSPVTVRFPHTQWASPTFYARTTPIFVDTPNIRLEGEPMPYSMPSVPLTYPQITTSQTGISAGPGFQTCPALYVGPDIPDTTYQAETALGATIQTATLEVLVPANIFLGMFMDLAELSDVGRIDGLSAFTFSFWINPGSIAPGIGDLVDPIVSSNGGTAGNDLSEAFFVFLSNSGANIGAQLYVGLRTSVTGFSPHFTSNALTANALNYVKVTYDGSFVYVYINGVLGAQNAQTGTIVQKWYERILIGAEPSWFPDRMNKIHTHQYTLGGILARNVSDVSTTIPSAEPVADTHTLFCFSFVNANRPRSGWVIATSSGATNHGAVSRTTGSYVWMRWQGKVSILPVNNVGVKHLGFNSRGATVYGSTWSDGYVERCEFSGTAALTFGYFSYPVRVRDCLFTPLSIGGFGDSWGLGIVTGTQFVHVTDCQFHGTPTWQIVDSVGNGGGTALLENSWIVGRGGRGSVFLANATALFNACWLDDDGGTVTDCLVFAGTSNARFNGGFVSLSNSAVPAIRAAGNAVMELNTTVDGVPGIASDVAGAAQASFVGGNMSSFFGLTITNGEVPLVVGHQEETGRKSFALSGTTLTMAKNDFYNRTFVFTGALTGDCTVTVPTVIAGYRRVIVNKTTGGHNIIIQGPSGAAAAGVATTATVASDGTNWNVE